MFWCIFDQVGEEIKKIFFFNCFYSEQLYACEMSFLKYLMRYIIDLFFVRKKNKTLDSIYDNKHNYKHVAIKYCFMGDNLIFAYLIRWSQCTYKNDGFQYSIFKSQ